MKRRRARSPEAIDFARFERATANEFARTVWQWVRNRHICNQKFRREYPIPPYTADFCCVELKLILEIDGADHFTETGQQRDYVRDNCLNTHAFRVVRIAGYEVLRDGRQVREMIVEEVKKRLAEFGRGAEPGSRPALITTSVSPLPFGKRISNSPLSPSPRYSGERGRG